MGCVRIDKRTWRDLGGCANPNLFRKMVSGRWTYWKILNIDLQK